MMLSGQHLLPRLPLPKLNDSLTRFIRAAKPLLSAKEFAETESAVADFVNSGVAVKLQSHLEHKAKTNDSWLADFWNNGAYLEYRDPLLFANPSCVMPPQNFNSPDDQFRFAAGVISTALDYRSKIIAEELKPEVVGKGRQLCMAQYNSLFDNSRMPVIPRDRMVAWDRKEPFQSLSKDAEVVIIYRNKIFNLKVDQAASDPQSIYNSIVSLKRYNDSPLDKPLGILTSGQRDSWAKTYGALESLSELNAVNLDAIRRSAFVVCLDTQLMPPVNSSYGPLHRTFDQVLHGGGTSYNSGNRWFDKTVQFIIGQDGVWGSCFEHTAGEAFIMVTLIDHVCNNILKKPDMWRSLNAGQESSNVSLDLLKFDVNSQLEREIENASKAFDILAADVDTYVNSFEGWGRNDASALKLSADGLAQMAFQLAYFRLYNKPASAYETGSLRRFLNSRTDTIRPCSSESLAMCQALTSRTPVSMEVAKELVYNALKAHGEYLSAACSGKGFDRHLFGLKCIAGEEGISAPALFSSPGYKKLNHLVLSTSQVTMATDNAGVGYVPLSSDGYSSCYNIGPHNITSFMTSWKSCPVTNTRKFATALNDAMNQIFEIASSSQMTMKRSIGGAKL